MKFWPVRIARTLTVSVGLLVFITVGAVFSIQWSASRKILADLGGRVVVRNLEVVSQAIRGYLDPVRYQVEYLSRHFETGAYEIDDGIRVSDLLTGSVAASPQIASVIVLSTNLQAIRIRRDPTTGQYQLSHPDLSSDPQFRAGLIEAQDRRSGYWAALHYNPEFKTTFINYRRPLHRNGKFIGVIAAAVTVESFSKIVADLSNLFGSTTFILYGQDRVLAHPNLLSFQVTQFRTEPVVLVGQVNDPILSALSRAVPSGLIDFSERDDIQFDELQVADTSFFVLRRPLTGYGETPLMIGIYRRTAEVDAPLRLLYLSGLLGLGLLVISLVGAVWISRSVSNPIRRVSEGVAQVGQLTFGDLNPLAPTWIKEVNDLSQSFNGMVSSLRFFETYVPRKLVQRLIKQGEDASVESEERELTVMFTDIAKFTSMCEGMGAKEVADFINEHLSILAECVEAEGGTIDKYIGDALMAFWGAPEKIENTAVGACRAAQSIAMAVHKDNKRRMAAGRKPVGVRIGIHTGPLVVGNIGAPSRINYTVVGDTVNTAQRIESLGKEINSDADVMILISASTQALLSDKFATETAGSFSVKGKEDKVEVYRLLV